MALLFLVVGACGGSEEPAVADAVDVEEQPTASAVASPQPSPRFQPTSEPAPTIEPGPTPAATPASIPDAPAPPSCDEVPTFYAADSVEVACAGSFALSPELFANNAGWHLFEAVDGAWVEIDYALTCCNEPDEIPLVELLGRNALDTQVIEDLCGVAGGCEPVEPAPPGDFDSGALRVDGFAQHDFGAAEAEVRDTLVSVFGQPIDVFDAQECGAGPMRLISYDEFTVNLQDGILIGWFYTASNPPLTTPSGVAPGIDEAALRTAYAGVEIDETTLGREFFFDVPSGFMAGFIEDGVVSSLYAGTNCFFR